MSEEYTVKLNIFEGPLDLLLHLIKVNELEITEISVSAITSQYLDYLRLMEHLDLDVAGDFLVMAATLLNIKLRTILPEPEEEVEEQTEAEGDDFLTARQLMQRLIEYRKFKEAAQTLGHSADRQSLIFVREVALPTLTQAEADPEVRGDLNLLLEAFSRVIKFVQRRDYHQVQEEEFTIEDKILNLRRRLLLESRVSVNELLSQCRVKIEMIVTVIAMLELCRLKELRVSQADSFDDILIERRSEAPEGATDETQPPTGSEAERLAALEADILASRTGLVDDGEPLEDDEDRMLEELLKPEEPSPARRGKRAPAPQEEAGEEPKKTETAGEEVSIEPAPDEAQDEESGPVAAESPEQAEKAEEAGLEGPESDGGARIIDISTAEPGRPDEQDKES